VVVGDLCDPAAAAAAVSGIEVVFHCAGNVATWDSRAAYERGNITSTQSLFEALAQSPQRGVRVVHLSTVDVYGYPSTPCDEDSRTSGGGFDYGESKLRGELIAREICSQAGIALTILRPGNVFGPESQFIARIGGNLRMGVMLLVDGGQANAGLIYIDNLIDDILWAAATSQPGVRCYNVRDPYDVTWRDFMYRYRAAIRGKGILISLPFAASDLLANALAALHRRLFPSWEPILHPLLVRVLGRTCGHDAGRIRHDAGPTDRSRVGFDAALEKSAQWYLSRVSGRHAP
jgi:nucleoside-diphosphate-sugar epimerase